MSRKRITMQMIADASGYSKYVVSKTLNAKEGVSDEARRKVLAVAKQLGYFKGNSMPIPEIEIQAETNIEEDGFVIVVMPNHRYQNAQSAYWGKVFDGIVDMLERNNIGAIVISSQNNLSGHVKAHRLLGIITVGLVSSSMLLELNKHDVPIVMVDHEDPIITADCIYADNLNGGNMITNHLIGLGHKELLFVGDTSWSTSFYERYIGFKMALEKAKLVTTNQTYILSLDYRAEEIEIQLNDHLTRLKKTDSMPSAFVCANDHIAYEMLTLLAEKGYQVPKDLSVTGFDNLNDAPQHTPTLTTVQVLKEAIGRRAVSMLLWRIQNHEFPREKNHIACDLIIRESTSTPSEKIEHIKI